MDSLLQDLRYAGRVLRRNPGFTAVAVTVLALGIGANTAVFGLANSLLLHPLYGRRSGELVGCFNQNLRNPEQYRPVSFPNYGDLRDRNTVFTCLAAHKSAKVGLREGETVHRLSAEFVTANYFATFGVSPSRGRAFYPEEETPGVVAPVVLVSHQYWIRHGADPQLLGKSFLINGMPFTVVGIMPEGFTGQLPYTCPDVWLPLGMYDAAAAGGGPAGPSRTLKDRSAHGLLLLGQLEPGLSLEKANAELRVLAQSMANEFPVENLEYTFIAGPLSRLYDSAAPARRGELSSILITFMALAGVVLLIGCLNLANLLLARGTARRQEIATRLALGGQRLRIVRQLLTEGLLLALLGGLLSLLVAVWIDRLLISTLARLLATVSSLPALSLILQTGIDQRVLAATLAFSVLSTTLFALGPAWKLSRANLTSDLKTGAGQRVRVGAGWKLLSARNLLVTVQIACSLTLVLTAGLFIHSALKLTQMPPGFDLENGVILEIDLTLSDYDEPHGRELFRTLTERAGALPGVQTVSLAQHVPYAHPSEPLIVLKEGADKTDLRHALTTGSAFSPQCNVIGTDYFKTLGAPLLRGREFRPDELQAGPAARVAIIDERLARLLWPGQDPLGKRLRFAGMYAGEGVQIVGLVPELRKSLFRPKQTGFVYLPLGQQYSPAMYLLVRATAQKQANDSALLLLTRQVLRTLDRDLPLTGLSTWHQFRAASPDELVARVEATLFSVFGALALGLALMGVYGVKAYMVAQRTHEIGIRLALGASHAQVIHLILREGLLLTVAGSALGLLFSASTTRLLQGALYEVKALDPLTFMVVPVIVSTAALLASYFPSRRVVKVDPMVALRHE